ncbi:MAG: nicotinamide-nucleotide amidohydrolase family protein [Xanthomonadales bacterium]|nr:nicotinamide-nucleotide amidohydrolase family protein [Xanthomonadales bacterium]
MKPTRPGGGETMNQEPTTLNLVTRLSEVLLESGSKLATAESCTGGWIAKLCTDLAGSSAWFERGFVTYSNSAKVDMLGVDRDALAREGAVSRAVAEQMALGAVRRSQAQVSLAVTGIAGPDGGSREKPVGTVWFAWAKPDGTVESEHRLFAGDRATVREETVSHALSGLLSRLTWS